MKKNKANNTDEQKKIDNDPIVVNIKRLISQKKKQATDEFKVVKKISLFFFGYLYISLIFQIQNWESNKKRLSELGIDTFGEYLPFILLLISFFLFSIEHLLNILTPDSETSTTEFESWFPKKERRRVIVRTIAIILGQIAITFILLGDLPQKHFTQNLINSFLRFEITLFTLFLIYTFIFYYITFNPEKILSRSLVNTGTSCWALWQAGALSFIFYIKHQQTNLFIFYTIIIYLVTMLLVILAKRDTVQWMIIKTVKPEILLNVFKNISQRAKDTIEALKIIDKLSLQEKYGVQQELLKQLSVEYSPKNSYIKNVVGGLLFFIICSLGEGIVQDLWKEGIESALCKYLNILCESKN